MISGWFKKIKKSMPKGSQIQQKRQLWQEQHIQWKNKINELNNLLLNDETMPYALNTMKELNSQELELAQETIRPAIINNPNFLCLLLGEHSTERIRKFTYTILSKFPVEKTVLSVLKIGDCRARACAAEILADIGTISVLPILEQTIKNDTDQYVKEYATLAIPKIKNRLPHGINNRFPLRTTKIFIISSNAPHLEKPIKQSILKRGIEICTHPGQDPDLLIEIETNKQFYNLYKSSFRGSLHEGIEVSCTIRALDPNLTIQFELTFIGQPPPHLQTTYKAEDALSMAAHGDCNVKVEKACNYIPDLILLTCSDKFYLEHVNKTQIENLNNFLNSQTTDKNTKILQIINNKLSNIKS